MPRERLRLPQQREKARWYPPQWPASLQYAHIQGQGAGGPGGSGAVSRPLRSRLDRAIRLVPVLSCYSTCATPAAAHGRQQTSVTKLIYRKQIRPRVGRGRGYCDGPARQQPQRGTVVTQIVTQTINGQLRGCPELAADLVVLWSG